MGRFKLLAIVFSLYVGIVATFETLIGVLQEFSERKVNLTRIESRPSREELGVYVFLIDFQGHQEDRIVKEALAAVREKAHYFRLFGSYPRYAEGHAL